MGVSQSESVHPDLNAAFVGGDDFLSRIKTLTDQREAIKKMLAELNLGRAARAAYDDATAKQQQADKALADARATSEKTVSAAQDKASGIVKDAESRANSLNADAEKSSKEADQLLRDAKQKNAEAAEKASKMAELERGHKDGIEKATAAEAEFRRKLLALNAAVKAVS